MAENHETGNYIETIGDAVKNVVKKVLTNTRINFGGGNKSFQDIIELLGSVTSDATVEALCGVLVDNDYDKVNCKKVFRKLIVEPPSDNEASNLLEKIYSAIKSNGGGGGGSGGPSKDCDKYVKLLKELKELVSTTKREDIEKYCEEKTRGNKSGKKRCVDALTKILRWPIIDTCYSDKRVEELKNGLERLKSMDSDCILVRLLLASYIGMLSKDNNVFERVEWVPLLLRAALRSSGSNSKDYIPVCPGRGDIAAVAYYLALCCGS